MPTKYLAIAFSSPEQSCDPLSKALLFFGGCGAVWVATKLAYGWPQGSGWSNIGWRLLYVIPGVWLICWRIFVGAE